MVAELRRNLPSTIHIEHGVTDQRSRTTGHRYVLDMSDYADEDADVATFGQVR